MTAEDEQKRDSVLADYIADILTAAEPRQHVDKAQYRALLKARLSNAGFVIAKKPEPAACTAQAVIVHNNATLTAAHGDVVVFPEASPVARLVWWSDADHRLTVVPLNPVVVGALNAALKNDIKVALDSGKPSVIRVLPVQ